MQVDHNIKTFVHCPLNDFPVAVKPSLIDNETDLVSRCRRAAVCHSAGTACCTAKAYRERDADVVEAFVFDLGDQGTGGAGVAP
jgi:hypothetical protein